MNEMLSVFVMVGGGLGTFLLGMKHLSEGLQAVSGSGLARQTALAHTLFNVAGTIVIIPFFVLVELDILNAYERIRAYYLNVAETLAGGK